MKKRLFIAINLPEKVKHLIDAEIAEFEKKMSHGIRFLDSHNWHITTTFLGYQEDMAIPDILKALEDSAPRLEAPEIEITSITYGPPGKSPRMIWLNGSANTSSAIAEIKKITEENFSNRNIRFDIENRKYNCHITLARFETNEVGELPPLDVKLNLKFTPQSLDLMESRLKRSVAEYDKLFGIDFQ